MTGARWRSGFVAALFGWHPLHVESVAWISERKDVLSAFFFLLCLRSYVQYARAPGTTALRTRHYRLALLFFGLGLLGKPMLVTVPFLLLLLDYWPLKRFSGRLSAKRLILEKIPLLTLSAAAGVATLWAQQPSVVSAHRLSLLPRIGNGLVSCLIYLKQMVWPVRLAAFYTHPESTLPVWEISLASLLLLLVSAGAIALRRKSPYLVTGWFWYLLMLLPVI